MTTTTTPPTTTPLTPHETQPAFAIHARLTANETNKGIILMWRNRRGAIAAFIGFVFTYLGFSMVVGGGFDRALMALTLPGLVALSLAQTAALQGAGGIAEEVNGGTLEQSQMSPASQSVRILGRLASLAIEGLAIAVPLAIGFALVFRLSFAMNPAVLIPVSLTVVDALGYGLLMTALTLRIASIGAVVHLFNMGIMFFGGMLLPVAAFPDGVHIFTRFVPTTLGVEASNIVLSGQPLAAAWASGTLPLLIVHATALLTLGWAIYIATIRRARRAGGLSPQ